MYVIQITLSGIPQHIGRRPDLFFLFLNAYKFQSSSLLLSYLDNSNPKNFLFVYKLTQAFLQENKLLLLHLA